MITLQFLICSILIIILIIWLINKKKYLENFGSNCSFTLDHEEPEFQKNPNDVGGCIKQCDTWSRLTKNRKNKCNITQCQERCLDCRDMISNDVWRDEENNIICPWKNEIQIKIPDAPKIRGVANDVSQDDDDASISIEWKKPESNGSYIINYVIEIKETLSNRNSVQVLYIPGDCDPCSFSISKLKKQTSYDISLRANGNISNYVNEVDIELSPISNIVTITTKGERGNSLRNTYSDLNGDFNKVSYNINNISCGKYGTNHILDNINHNDIDIKNYVEQRDKTSNQKEIDSYPLYPR
jgi:hypothetical protein